METEKYILPSFFNCYLMYGELEGLKDDEIEIIESFIEKEKLGNCLDVVEDEGFQKYHDLHPDILACDCSTYTFELLSSEEEREKEKEDEDDWSME
jgi:hypothetical protein